MKNLFLLSLVALLILAGCTQDSLQTDSVKQTKEQLHQARAEQTILLFEKAGVFTEKSTADSRASCNRVPICHNGNSIVVNNSAVPAHLGHGDQLTCCATSCINESAELQNGGPYEFYYDMDVWDCFDFQGHGYDDFVILGYASGYIAAEAFTHHGTTYYFVYTHLYENHSFPCDELVTQAEYECASAYLKSVVAANSCIPNACD